MKIYWVSEDRLSEILKVTTRRIRDVCVAAKNKEKESIYLRKYDLIKSIQLYLENINKDKKDYAVEIKKLDKELKEHKLNVVQEKYVEIDVIEKIFIDTLMKVKMKLSNLAGELSSELIDKNNKSEIEDIINSEVIEILKQLSDFNLKGDANEDD
ncbi:MAG: hypothetical protein ACRC0S_02095 [Fusobacteriaceae bacterium]